MYCSAGATGKLQYRYSTREQCCTRSSACGCGLCCLITWSRAARWQCAVLCCAAMRATGMRELQWCAVLGAGQSRSTRLRERRRRAAFVHSFGTVDAQSLEVSILQFSRVFQIEIHVQFVYQSSRARSKFFRPVPALRLCFNFTARSRPVFIQYITWFHIKLIHFSFS